MLISWDGKIFLSFFLSEISIPHLFSLKSSCRNNFICQWADLTQTWIDQGSLDSWISCYIRRKIWLVGWFNTFFLKYNIISVLTLTNGQEFIMMKVLSILSGQIINTYGMWSKKCPRHLNLWWKIRTNV